MELKGGGVQPITMMEGEGGGVLSITMIRGEEDGVQSITITGEREKRQDRSARGFAQRKGGGLELLALCV